MNRKEDSQADASANRCSLGRRQRLYGKRHTPDRSRLPRSLAKCNWWDLRDAIDMIPGTTWLMAVPVDASVWGFEAGRDWEYQLSVIDFSTSGLHLDGDPWVWSLDDVDFMLPLAP